MGAPPEMSSSRQCRRHGRGSCGHSGCRRPRNGVPHRSEQLQAARLLPLVQGPADVADGGAPGGPRHPARAGAPMGAVVADPAAHAAGRVARAGRRPPSQAQAVTSAAGAADCDIETVQAQPRRIGWGRLLTRVFDIDTQRCPNCGSGEMKIIAAILERPVIEKILSHLGLAPQPPSPDTSSPVDCLCLARGRATGPARPARGLGAGRVRRVRPGCTEPRSGGAGFRQLPKRTAPTEGTSRL